MIRQEMSTNFGQWKAGKGVATESTDQRKQRKKYPVVGKSRSNQLVAQTPEVGGNKGRQEGEALGGDETQHHL